MGESPVYDTEVIYDKDTSVLPIYVTEGEDETAYDLTDHTIKGVISTNRLDTKKLVLTVTSHTSPTGGESAITITPANVVTMGGVGDYWLTVVLVNGSAQELTLLTVHLEVRERISIAEP